MMNEVALGHKLGVFSDKPLCPKCGVDVKEDIGLLYQNEHLEDKVVSGVYMVTPEMILQERSHDRVISRLIVDTYRKEMKHYYNKTNKNVDDPCHSDCTFCEDDLTRERYQRWEKHYYNKINENVDDPCHSDCTFCEKEANE
jgi:hypothetical protein